MTQEAHTPIVVWEVSRWTGAEPNRKEYAKETAHFYVRNDGRRVAKTSRYYQFFATQEEAQAECDRRAAAKHDAAERERRQIACVNALAGIPIEAIEGGVVAELVEAARGMLPNNLNMACNMSDEAIIPLDVTFGELRALFDALAKLEASK